jgi:hypothetical protein
MSPLNPQNVGFSNSFSEITEKLWNIAEEHLDF